MSGTIWLNDQAEKLLEKHREPYETPSETVIRIFSRTVDEDQVAEMIEERLREFVLRNPQKFSAIDESDFES